MSRRWFAITAVALALTVGACGKGGAEDGDSGSGDVKTGPGTTADTISLGYLPDLSGVFAPNGKAMMEGAKLYWDAKNKAGGICGRTVELKTQDTGYDPQKAVAAYQQISGDVVGLGLVLGSSITSALLPSVKEEDMFLNFAGWTSDILPSENVAIAGTTYDIEAINAIDFLMREHGVKSGDTVGHLYFEGDYGENALKGSKFAAEKHGLKIVEQKITPAETDMTGQVAAFRRAGVKAILFSAAPPQAASLAGVAASQKLDVPIVANGPGWTPQLLTTPAAGALEKNYYVVSSMAPLNVESEGVQKFLDAYKQAYPQGHAVLERLALRVRRRPDRRRGAHPGVRGQGPHAQGRARRAALADRARHRRHRGRQARLQQDRRAAEPPRLHRARAKDAPGGLAVIGEPGTSDDAKSYTFGGS